jgi:glycosyltransferase involved in cell wall biosynthesis
MNSSGLTILSKAAKPVLPLRAALSNYTGYGLHAGYIVQCFQQFGYTVEMIDPHDHSVKHVKRELVLGPADHGICEDDWFFTMHETTRLTQDGFKNVQKAGAVIVPCHWNAECWNAQGITKPIYVSRLGYNPDIFYPGDQFPALCTFGAAANVTLSCAPRKNIEATIDAFCLAFPKEEDVRLRVKLSADCDAKFTDDPRIDIIREVLSEQAMADWTRSLTAFVSTSRGEAFGFFNLQAMACGVPLLACNYGGVQEYHGDGSGYCVDYTLVTPKDCYHGVGLWAEPDVPSLIEQMRHVYSNQEDAQIKGHRASVKVKNFTWYKVCRELESVLKDSGFWEPPKTTIQVSEVLRGEPRAYNSTCIVQLGRYGDLLNILPIAKDIYDRTKERPVILVASEFADLLTGVSYANAEIWPGPYHIVKPAIHWARERFREVLVTQVAASDYMVEPKCESFMIDSWRMAGYEKMYGQLPLVIDNRAIEEEFYHAKKGIDPTRPNVVIALKSHSSPFPYVKELKAELDTWSDRVNFIDLSDEPTRVIFDLLGVLTRADLLITIDSALLHLAAATEIQIIALITDRPTYWHGSRPQKHPLLSLRYSEVLANFSEIHEAIESTLNRTFFHVFSDYVPKNPDTLRRFEFAKSTWPKGDGWLDCPITDDHVRLWMNGGDPTELLPYVKDVVNQAIREHHIGENDIIVLTNRDSCLAPTLVGRLKTWFLKNEACYSFRRDFLRLDALLSEDQIMKGFAYDGCDLFAFKKGWWIRHQNDYADFLLGRSEWDRWFRCLVESTSPGQCALDGLVYHEWHMTDRVTKENGKSPAEDYNVYLARALFYQHKKSRHGGICDRIISFYRHAKKVEKLPLPDLSKTGLSNNPVGIGDVLLLTSLPKVSTEQKRYTHVFSRSKHFATMMKFNPYYRPFDGRATLSADFLQTQCALGNGHFIQRLQRAWRLKPDLLPKGYFNTPGKKVKGRCAVHLEAGFHAIWQREHLHYRGREVYPHHLQMLRGFMYRHRHDMEFFEVGDSPHEIEFLQNKTKMPLEDTITFLDTCEWFIGIISGPMHLATALGAKCIVIINFPKADQIFLPTLVDIGQVESEWFYPQNVHLHEDSDGPLVRILNIRHLEMAVEGHIYPFWSHEYLPLIHEKV